MCLFQQQRDTSDVRRLTTRARLDLFVSIILGLGTIFLGRGVNGIQVRAFARPDLPMPRGEGKMRPNRQNPNRGNSASSTPVTPTTAERLADGTMLEFVRVKGESKLVIWRNNRPRLSERFEFGDRIYEPMSLSSTILDAIRFPGSIARCGSPGELFRKILDAASKFSGLPDRELRPIPYWALSSWFPEVVSSLPTLVVTAPSRADAHRFFRLMRCFCRRGVLLTELSPSGFLALPMHLKPTVLMEQSKLACQLRGYLRTASTSGGYVPRAGGFLDVRCVRAVYCDEDDTDSELREGTLRVSLFPAENAAFFDTGEEDRLSAEFQAQLLQYRCRNFQAVRESTFDVPGFTTGVRDLARSLGASVLGDPTLTAGITDLLSAQDEDVRASWNTLPGSAIIVTVLALVHERKEPRVPVKKLTEFVNAVLSANGEIKEYNPMEIGHLLSRLDLPRSRVAGGMVVELTRQVSRRVHELKQRYGVTTSPDRFPGCPDCEPPEVPGNRRLLQVV
jgi:hypothetical protein